MYGKALFNEVYQLRSYMDTALYLSDNTALESFTIGKMKIDWSKLFKTLRDAAIRIYKIIKGWFEAIKMKLKGTTKNMIHTKAWNYCVSYVSEHGSDLNLSKIITSYAALVQGTFKSWKTDYINREPDVVANSIERIEAFSKDLDGKVQIATNGLNGVRNLIRENHRMDQYQDINTIDKSGQDAMLNFMGMYKSQENTMLSLIDTISAAYTMYTAKARDEKGMVEDIWGPVLQIIYAESDTASKLLSVTATISSAVNMMMEECLLKNKNGSDFFLIPLQKNQIGILSQEVK